MQMLLLFRIDDLLREFSEYWDGLLKKRKDLHRQFANLLSQRTKQLDDTYWELEDMQSLCKELHRQATKATQALDQRAKIMEAAMTKFRKLERKGTYSAMNRRLLHEAETECVNAIAKYNAFVQSVDEDTLSNIVDVRSDLNHIIFDTIFLLDLSQNSQGCL